MAGSIRGTHIANPFRVLAAFFQRSLSLNPISSSQHIHAREA